MRPKSRSHFKRRIHQTINMTPTSQESEIRNTNPRKKFASYLRKLSDLALFERHQQTKSDYKAAKERGECSLEAFLYFDLAQLSDEMVRRNTKQNQ